MKATWVVDNNIFDRNVVNGHLISSIVKSGANLFETRTELGKQPEYGPYGVDDCVILYGPVGFIRKCNKQFTPGAWGYSHRLDCANYYPFIENDLLLNGKGFFLPFGVIESRINDLLNEFGGKFFLRPNSGFKTFTGLTITKENARVELNSLKQITSAMPDTLCLLSKVVDIKAEFRYLIGDHEVIAYSEYRWDNKLDIRADTDNDCLRLAKYISRQEWQPDVVYTCDVALTQDGPYIIEMNSFASAGLYAMDKDVVVERLNHIALKEFIF